MEPVLKPLTPPTLLMRRKKSLAQLEREKKEIWKERVRARMKKSLLFLPPPTLQVIKWTHLPLPQLAVVARMLQLPVCLEVWGGIVV